MRANARNCRETVLVKQLEDKLKMEITIQSKDVYGRTLYYPVCKRAELFAKLIDKKTLTPETLEIAEKLGYTINIQQPTWR